MAMHARYTCHLAALHDIAGTFANGIFMIELTVRAARSDQANERLVPRAILLGNVGTAVSGRASPKAVACHRDKAAIHPVYGRRYRRNFETEATVKKRLLLFAERPVNLCPEQGEQRIAVALGNERADQRLGASHVLPTRSQPFCCLMAFGDIERSLAVHLEPPRKRR